MGWFDQQCFADITFEGNISVVYDWNSQAQPCASSNGQFILIPYRELLKKCDMMEYIIFIDRNTRKFLIACREQKKKFKEDANN